VGSDTPPLFEQRETQRTWSRAMSTQQAVAVPVTHCRGCPARQRHALNPQGSAEKCQRSVDSAKKCHDSEIAAQCSDQCHDMTQE